jgi:hypothetical protein
MDALTLLGRAQAAGLSVQAVGSGLKIRGPKRAEPIVKLLAQHKPAVLALITLGKNVQRWQERYTALSCAWTNGRRRSWAEARRLAWGDLQNEWHALHGTRFPTWQCAGCRKPLSGFNTLDLNDGNRVHLDDIECLITFGRRWRSIAHEWLVACGLKPPDCQEDEP